MCEYRLPLIIIIIIQCHLSIKVHIKFRVFFHVRENIRRRKDNSNDKRACVYLLHITNVERHHIVCATFISTLIECKQSSYSHSSSLRHNHNNNNKI